MNKNVKFLTQSAIIGASYAVLTLVLSPLSFGPVQVRISECLISFAVFNPAAIPGLTIGCFLSGILGPNGIVDAVIGSIASLIGASLTYLFRSKKYIAPICNVIINSITIGLMQYYIYGVSLPKYLCILFVFIGEFISSFLLAMGITKCIEKRMLL